MSSPLKGTQRPSESISMTTLYSWTPASLNTHLDSASASSMLPVSSLLYGGVEEGVAEEEHGAAEDDPGVVAGLQAGDQQRVLAHRMRVLEDRHEDIIKGDTQSWAQETRK
ncbi:hypothetical protein CRUP_025272 [Coryphaenoides rupestris]|nr:hypothetical protein CRUP_025272 [Coryphaenoides rupestris]